MHIRGRHLTVIYDQVSARMPADMDEVQLLHRLQLFIFFQMAKEGRDIMPKPRFLSPRRRLKKKTFRHLLSRRIRSSGNLRERNRYLPL